MPETLRVLRESLTGRYSIERELGRGGMATVYLARDVQHDRPVALKVLEPELAASLGAERFQREIKLAARLQHPHILSVHDSGRAGDLLWFTMPFVEGESLRDRLARETQLPIEDAVRICREAALALDYAHRQGVVHRDIKPENILLSDGQALVADFGIAVALGGGSQLTQTGMAIGTPQYMSPEQATGERSLDGRTDVYSLACVLYEMLAGEPPFSGPNSQAIVARIMSEAPRSLTAVRPAVSPGLAGVIAKAMSRTAADRYTTAGEFSKSLERTVSETIPVASVGRSAKTTWIAVAAGIVAIAGILALATQRRGSTADDSVQRVAVLPFENAGSAEDEYFADGVTDEVRSKLAAIPGLQVTARASTRQYKRTAKAPREIGRELEVQYLLTGTVRWSKAAGRSRVRVTPELIQVSNAATRWSEPFDTVLSDVFEVQASIASRVAQALNVAIGAPAKARLAERPTSNIDAYDEFLKGEQITQSVGVSDSKILTAGLPHYERAAALDSNFYQAWSAIARSQSFLNGSGPSVEGVERARIAAERALALAPDRPEARLAMAAYLRDLKLDYPGAHDQYVAGLKTDPNNADLLTGLATLERSLGKFDDQLEHAKQAQRIDPRSVATARRVATAYSDLRRYREALDAWDRTLALAPDNLAIIHGKVFTYLSMGYLDSVHALVEKKLQTVDTTALLVRFALYQETMWALPEYLWPKILHLTPADFGNDRGHWGLKVGGTYMLLGDTVHARAFGDTARLAFEAQLKDFPERAQLHELRGRALALGGHRKEAIEEGERSLKLRETSLDAATGPYVRFQVARILIQAGESERALDLIEPLLSTPASDLTPAYLRIDPTFRSIRGNPRFQRLAAKN